MTRRAFSRRTPDVRNTRHETIYSTVVPVFVPVQLAVSTMAVVLSSFFHGITDRRIGATYTTLLHSCSNFGI